MKVRTAVYACPTPNCAKSFNWKGNLNRHLRYECGLQPRFKCPYCAYCCKVKGDVNKHIIRKHQGLAIYVVDLFASTTRGKGSTLRVDDHRQCGNWLMKPSKYACPNPNCRSVFAWKRNLTSHLRYQCGQQPRFKCPYCEYKCKVKTDIRKHIKTKHKNRDVYVIDVFQSWQLLQ
ncbi:zinc finger protein 64-like [Apis dorsata]|uniref:zinc finger protein 64-like n=1 Tax=Apis dorsata TaxID=7462 RepID=UPI0012937264|nr:zinc finger protein 64-like [Apis dorsata]